MSAPFVRCAVCGNEYTAGHICLNHHSSQADEVVSLRSRLDLAIEALLVFPQAAQEVWGAMLEQNDAIFEEGNRGPTPALKDAWAVMLRVVDDTFAALESVAAEIEAKEPT